MYDPTSCDNFENLQAVRDQQKQEPQITLLNSTASSENRTINEQNSENNTKAKPKRTVNNTMKIKKDDIDDKSYILDLENQINILKSTLNLYNKSKDINQEQPDIQPLLDSSEKRRQEHSRRCDHACSHNCCAELKDKIQENRMRMLEMQMMQNFFFINNALHIHISFSNKTTIPEYCLPIPCIYVSGNYRTLWRTNESRISDPYPASNLSQLSPIPPTQCSCISTSSEYKLPSQTPGLCTSTC